MRIAVGADHAGWDLKPAIVGWLKEKGIPHRDLSPHPPDPQDDYPDVAVAVARSVASGDSDLGIAICGTGVGSCIAANKVAGVRAALCTDTVCARCSRSHNDANVLCLGGRILGVALALGIVEAWLDTPFSGAPRHQRRLEKVARLESEGNR